MTEAEKELIEAALQVDSLFDWGDHKTDAVHNACVKVRAERAPKPRYFTRPAVIGESSLWVHDRDAVETPALMPESWANLLVDALNAKEEGK